MPAEPTATAEQIKDANWRYHDAAASSYDAKWGIDFGPTGQRQVLAKLAKALGHRPATPFADALEIGAGTGYFSLNLLQLGAIKRATATDISPGMLATLVATADSLGVDARAECTDAEELPFEDESFDLVFGHAVLHHIPDLEKAFSEFARVLRPGGTLAFCGEPSRHGDRIAAVPKRSGLALAPLWRTLLRASPAAAHDGAPNGNGGADMGLEFQVDVHSFSPGELRALIQDAGLTSPRIRGEELLANVYGWTLRTLESSAEPDEIPALWRHFAFRSYLALQRLDSAILEPNLPAGLFYNLLLSARKPA